MKRTLALFLFISLFLASWTVAASVPTMSKDELKAELGSENLVILDVRQGRDWSTSEFKIKGALRVDGGDLSVAEKFSNAIPPFLPQ